MYSIFYKITTGEIVKSFQGPEGYDLLQLEDGWDIYRSDTYIDCGTHYIDIYYKEPVELPVKPNQYSEFNWETKQWEDPLAFLDTAKTDYKVEVNKLAGGKILSNYPTYRQMNYNRDPTAQATIDMNLWIDEIRAESNVATSSIDSATDLATIEGIVESFTAYLASL